MMCYLNVAVLGEKRWTWVGLSSTLQGQAVSIAASTAMMARGLPHTALSLRSLRPLR